MHRSFGPVRRSFGPDESGRARSLGPAAVRRRRGPLQRSLGPEVLRKMDDISCGVWWVGFLVEVGVCGLVRWIRVGSVYVCVCVRK